MIRAFPIVLVAGWLLQGCGHAKKTDRVVLVKTEITRDAGTKPDLVDLILKDERRAADVLRTAMTLKQTDLAPWAAIYALRLGIRHDEQQAYHALAVGIDNPDPLLAALSWRWLATLNQAPIPEWPDRKPSDPVVEVMAALAAAARGPVPKRLASALGLPDSTPTGKERHAAHAQSRVSRLIGLAMPYDNGPLGLAIGFIEARRSEWVEGGPDNAPAWIASRLRDELVQLVLGQTHSVKERILLATPKKEPGVSHMASRLENPLVSRSRKVLLKVALLGPLDLRRDGLRAIAVQALTPVAGDFGAAAAGLEAEDQRLRIEAARTFLLLSTRARSNHE